MISIDGLTLEALVNRAGREAPRTPEERRAEEDARELLRENFAAQFPVVARDETTEYYQPTLFDPTPYA